MRLKAIERQIYEALQLELQDHALEAALQAHFDEVSRLVVLEEDGAGKRLLDFVVSYVRAVPTLLTDLCNAARALGLIQYVQPLAQIAQEFFRLSFGPRTGLGAMMVKAYLAHRLLEEVNEVCIFQAGEPMISMDMTMTNVIIHTLIGEPFANDLDEMVAEAVQRFFESNVDDVAMEPTNLVPIFQKLPSLSGEAGLRSALGH